MYTIDISAGQATKILLEILQREKYELLYDQKHNNLREDINAEGLLHAINMLLEHYGSWR